MNPMIVFWYLNKDPLIRDISAGVEDNMVIGDSHGGDLHAEA